MTKDTNKAQTGPSASVHWRMLGQGTEWLLPVLLAYLLRDDLAASNASEQRAFC